MTPCKVYRSEKKAETYLYLAESLPFDELPDGLRDQFGEATFVLSLQLSDKQKLARVNVEKVMESLSESGYYLQLPPKLPVEEEITQYLL
jgi:uncharacterized protein YcgL (UPF0745 family)